jgi:hypothetical protein
LDTISTEFLLKGAVYNLEQCGLLLRDASLLVTNRADANGLVLTIFAWEALGKWVTLRNLRREVLGGRILGIEEVAEICGDHVNMLRAGNLSVTMTEEKNSGLGQLIQSRFLLEPGSEEWIESSERLDDATDRKRKRVPDERHKWRLAAQYVDPLPNESWRRPIEVSRELVERCLQDAGNDYAGQYDRYNNHDVHRDDDPEFYAALEAWRDRPTIVAV